MASYFDVPAAHLRSDPVIYLEAEQLYQTPAALMPLAESNFEITDVTEADSIIQVSPKECACTKCFRQILCL